MSKLKTLLRSTSLILLLLTTAIHLFAQLSPADYYQGIQNGFNRYKTNWKMEDALVIDSTQATVHYFNKYLNDTLEQVSFKSSGAIYFGKFQGFTVYALDSLNTELEEKLIDSPLVGYIVLNSEEYNSTEVLADSVYLKITDIMQLFQTGWPTYLPPEISNGFKAFFNRAENWGAVIFDKIVSKPVVSCYDINGKKIPLNKIQRISSTQINFSFPNMKNGIYILAPESENQKFESVKFNW